MEGLAPAILLGVMGNSVLYIMPLLVGAMVSDRGFSEQWAGFMVSADLGGYALATAVTAFMLGRISRRRMALGGIALMIAANIGATFVFGRDFFALIRFASGLGGGVLAAIAAVQLGQTPECDRNYGMLFAMSLLFGTVGLWGLPLVLGRFGLNGAYFLIAMLALSIAFAAASLPDQVHRTQVAPVAGRTAGLLASAVLASILLVSAEQNAVYVYIERIGIAAGLTGPYIGFSLGVANLTGFAGATLVAWLGTRFGRVMPLLVATIAQLFCLALLMGRVSAGIYLGALGVMSLAWNIVNPFQMGILAGFDATGKSLALATTVTGIGLAIGPAAAALMIGGHGYDLILGLAGGLAVIGLALLLFPLRLRVISTP